MMTGNSNSYGNSSCVNLVTKRARWLRDDDEIRPKETFTYL